MGQGARNRDHPRRALGSRPNVSLVHDLGDDIVGNVFLVPLPGFEFLVDLDPGLCRANSCVGRLTLWSGCWVGPAG